MHSPLSRLAFASSGIALAMLFLSFAAIPTNALTNAFANPVLAGYSLTGIEKVSNAFFAFENKTPSSVFLLLKTSRNSSELLLSLEENASNGTPSNHSLCSALFSVNSTAAGWLEVPLEKCPRLKQKIIYHVVLSAVSAANASNASPLDYATVYYAFNKNSNDSFFFTKPFASASWRWLNNSIPLFALKYSDGSFWRHGGRESSNFSPPALILTDINSCQTLSSANTYYRLTASVGNDSAACFYITAANVTLNCLGNTVNYSQTGTGYGVYVNGVDNATILNCVFNQTNSASTSSHAVWFSNSDYSIVNNSNFTLRSNYSNGVYYFASSDYSEFGNNTLQSGGKQAYPVYISSSNNNTVENNSVYSVSNPTYNDYIYSIFSNGGNNGTIRKNYVYASGTGWYNSVVYLVNGMNNTVDGNTVVSYVYGDPVYLYNCDYCTVKNNNLKTEIVLYFRGIRLYNSNEHCLIFNNTINATSSGVTLEVQSNFNNVSYNMINASYGIYATTNSSNNVFTGNAISTRQYGSGGEGGYYLTNSHNNTVDCQGSVINANALTWTYGFNINNETNTIIKNCNITGYYYGIYATASNNSNFSSNYIQNSVVNSVSFIDSIRNTVLDSTLSAVYSGSGKDVYSTNIANNTFLNVTFNKSAVTYADTSALTVKWYADVHVTNPDGKDTAGANVNVSNTLNAWLQYEYFNLTTNGTGWIARQNVTEYFQNITGVYNFTPHNIAASKQGYLFTGGAILLGNVTQNNVISGSSTFTIVLSENQSLTDCTTLSRNNAIYNLTANISNSPWNICMNVTGQNVTLDCQGNHIGGPFGTTYYGVFVNNTVGFTMRNCHVQDWGVGVYVNASNNTNVSSSNITGNSPWQFNFWNSWNDTIQDSYIGGGKGLYSTFGKNQIEFNTVAGANADNDKIYIRRNVFGNTSGGIGSGSGIVFYCLADTAVCSSHQHEIIIENNNFSGLIGRTYAYQIWFANNYSNATIQYNRFFEGNAIIILVASEDGLALTIYNNSFARALDSTTGNNFIFIQSTNTTANITNNAFYGNKYSSIASVDYYGDGNDHGLRDSILYNNSIYGGGIYGNFVNSVIDCNGQPFDGTIGAGYGQNWLFVASSSGASVLYNNTIRNCNVTYCDGYCIYSFGNYCRIYNNSVNGATPGANYGIGLTANNNVVFNNSIQNVGYGISASTGDNNTVFNNSVKNAYIPGGQAYGIYFTSVTNSNFSYNYVENVTADDWAITGGSLCLYSYQSNYNKIHDNRITDCPYYTILDSISTGNEYYNNFVNNSNFSFMFTGGAGTPDNNATMHNNVINGTKNVSISLLNYAVNITSYEDLIENDATTIVADVYLGNSINYGGLDQNQLTLINTTFNKSLITVRPDNTNSNLTVKWYVDIHVVDPSLADIANANVNISNTLNPWLQYEYFNLTANSTGWVTRQNVTEFFENETAVYNFTPHNIAASKEGYWFAGGYAPESNVTQGNEVTQQKTFTIVLTGGGPLTGCRDLNIANSYYTLSQSIYSPGATCFTITANNVTLDCNSFYVTSDKTVSTYGVYTNGYDNATIKNCIISSFDSSVYLEGASDNATIYASTLNDSLSREVYVVGSNARIYSNLLSSGGDGLDFEGDDVVVFNNTILNSNSEGVMADDLGLHSNVNISYNVIQNATDSCLYLQVQNSYIHNNTCSGSQLEGIWFKGGSTNNYVYGNWVWNGTVGIGGTLASSFVYGNTLLNITRTPGGNMESAGLFFGPTSDANQFFNNVIYNNSYGILFNGSSNNYIYSNNISYNTVSNVNFNCRKVFGSCSNSDAVNNVVLNNTLQGGTYGFYDIGWSSATLLSNTFFNNSVSGASIASVYFDTASGNTVADSTLSADYASGANDAGSANSANNTFINVTFNKSAVYWGDAASGLTVKWYVDVHAVNSSASGDVASATIEIFDVNGSSVYSGSTNSTGWITRQNVTEYIQNQSSTVNYTPHSFKGSKTGFLNNQTTASVSQNQLVLLFLPDDWHVIYGNVTLNQTLANTAGSAMDLWNATQGNVYVACQSSNVNWSALQALGINASGGKSTDSFNRADSALNLIGSNDSIRKRFASGTGITADTSVTFIVHGRTIDYVPIAYSTNSSNFVTGILWDTSDGGQEYSNVTKQDLVFVTALNPNQQGEQGVYAFELLFPLTLANYTGSSHNASITVEAR